MNCHRWCFARHVARYRSSAASVHRCHELARPTAAFLSICCSHWVQMCAVGWRKVCWKEHRCYSLDCLAHAVNGNIALQEDKELATDLTHDRCWVRNTSRSSSSTDNNQVHSHQLGYTHGHHHWPVEGRMCLAADALVTPAFGMITLSVNWTCWRPAMHAQARASYTVVYQFCSLFRLFLVAASTSIYNNS